MSKTKGAIATILLAATVSGCANQQHQWAAGPNARGTFEEAKGRCMLLASNGDPGYVAVGSPGFVAGASLGHAIAASVKAQNDFNACMSANGFVVDDLKVGDKRLSIDEAKAMLLQYKAESIGCIVAVRAKPKYQPIISHMADPNEGRYSFAQMSNQQIPTADEGSLIAAYEDDVQPCRDALVAKVSKLSPATGMQLKSRFDEATTLVLQLIQRRLSWGEYATKAQALINSAGATKT